MSCMQGWVNREIAMSGRLQDKVALVIGAGSIAEGWGNGKATAVLFAREGAKVFGVDINRDAVQTTVDIITGEGGSAARARRQAPASRGCASCTATAGSP